MNKQLTCDMCGLIVDSVCTVDIGFATALYCKLCLDIHDAQENLEKGAVDEDDFLSYP